MIKYTKELRTNPPSVRLLWEGSTPSLAEVNTVADLEFPGMRRENLWIEAEEDHEGGWSVALRALPPST